MKIHLRIDSVAAQAQLRRWGGEFRVQVRHAVERAMIREGRELRDAVRRHVAGRLSVARSAFLKSFNTRVYAKDPKRLPALYVGSRIPWAGMHETGGTLGGKMLIPINGRVGRKRFKAQVAELMRGGNAYFVKNARGNVVLMAENLKEHDRPLAGFKRRHRQAEGIKRLKRGADIPIAVLVPRVTLKKRLDIEGVVVGRMPELAQTIEDLIGQID